ncbi:MAG: primosomal protein, partial [Actinotalea sp.]|nr:primosomal protein [Actinotalea sp.]
METTGAVTAEQLTLAGIPGPRAARPSPARSGSAGSLADDLPVAVVLVDRPQAHLDRPFEYAVPAGLATTAQPGVRVKVRFAGQDLDGFVIAREATAQHGGDLTALRRVVSPEVVLGPEVLRLATAVARRYVGTLADVLRLAVPPRHARVEQETWPEGEPSGAEPDGDGGTRDPDEGVGRGDPPAAAQRTTAADPTRAADPT